MNLPYTNFHNINLDWIVKVVKALKGGAPDQVLVKKSNRDFDFIWKTLSAITGGVNSVNGQTGDVNLTATDVGALPDTYTPPTEIVYITTSTTYAEITSILSSSKLPILVTGTAPFYAYTGKDGSNNYRFIAVVNELTWTNAFQYKCSPSSVWSNDLHQLAVLNSPSFTGSPKAPTKASTDNSTNIATTAFIKSLGYVDTAGAAAAAPVQSVNGQTGAVVLAAASFGVAADKLSADFSSYELSFNKIANLCVLIGQCVAAGDKSAWTTYNVVLSGGVEYVPTSASKLIGNIQTGGIISGLINTDGSITLNGTSSIPNGAIINFSAAWTI